MTVRQRNLEVVRRAKTLPLIALMLLASTPGYAQRRPERKPNEPRTAPGARQVPQQVPPNDPQEDIVQPNMEMPPPIDTQAPGAAQQAQAQQGSRPIGPRKPTCDEARKKAKYNVYFDKVELEKLVQTISDATCKTFIVGENVRGRISIIGPENGKVEVNADQFFNAFLSALDANGLAVVPHGKFMKIVEKRAAKQGTIPTIVDPDASYPTNDQMVTKIIKVRYAELEQLRGVLQQLVTKDGDTMPFQPDTIIVNDVASNIHRLEKLASQLDRRSSSDEVRIVQIKYASAQDVADKVQKLFESRTQRPGQRPGTLAPTPTNAPAGAATPPGAAPTPSAPSAAAATPATLSQIITDERSNRLIIVASPSAFERIQDLIDAIDIPISGEGRVNVYPLENANAEDIAATLQALASGGSSGGGRAGPRPQASPGPAGSRGPPTATSAELFSGEVKISADKSSNSLVIIASQGDYRNLVKVIEKLDIPRRQVFIEAVIMEVNLNRNSELGVNLHAGYALSSDRFGQLPVVVGTKYDKSPGLPPSFSLANLANFGGFLAGLQGPAIPLSVSGVNLNIPAFGVILHALQESSDVNVLSTPHILTSDNEEAEIKVGQNVPFQAGYSPGGVGNALSSLGGLTGQGGAAGAAGGINPAIFGSGLLNTIAPINRQNVELSLSVKPQINESDFIRLVINEKTEEIASEHPVLGPTTSNRSAKTTVVAKDQQTVVLGGIMQDRQIESVTKTPILGDLPILGHLFREQTRRKVKTNLLLFLTPYIIRDQSDFQRIFERKMKERQQFIELFYGQVPGYEVAIDFSRKQGPFTRMQQVLVRESLKVEHGGPGQPGERVIRPGSAPLGAPSSSTPTASPSRSNAPLNSAPVPGVPPPPVDGPAVQEPPPLAPPPGAIDEPSMVAPPPPTPAAPPATPPPTDSTPPSQPN